jgi:hypothetical protein
MYDSSQIDTKILFIKVIFRKVTPKPLITQTRHAFFAPHPILCDFPDCHRDDEIDTIGTTNTIGTTESIARLDEKSG